jgi:hypothetical protein
MPKFAAMSKFILEVKDGVSLFMNEHVPYPDGWYWRTDAGPYNGPFESIDDAREAAVIASDPGVEIKVIDTEGRILEAPHDPPGGHAPKLSPFEDKEEDIGEAFDALVADGSIVPHPDGLQRRNKRTGRMEPVYVTAEQAAEIKKN